MKTMKIAVSRELVSKVSTHREKVMLENTDFTAVAAVVITVVESYSGILALLKRTGFQLPVFMFSTEPGEVPEGVTAIISGKAQELLELESAACRYEENLLPPFFDTLSQYVAMGNSTFACSRGCRARVGVPRAMIGGRASSARRSPGRPIRRSPCGR